MHFLSVHSKLSALLTFLVKKNTLKKSGSRKATSILYRYKRENKPLKANFLK